MSPIGYRLSTHPVKMDTIRPIGYFLFPAISSHYIGSANALLISSSWNSNQNKQKKSAEN
jgi:hypothetical protein